MSKINFDATKVAPQVALDPVPSGWYPAVVTKEEQKPTGKPGGKRLALEWTILDGEFKGRKVFDGFNLENKNPIAAEIGQKQLSALCHATGELVLKDTAQLLDKAHELKVGLVSAYGENAKGERTPYGQAGNVDDYEAKNEYKGCRALEGAAAAAAPAGKTTPPKWAKPGATPAAEPEKPADTGPTPELLAALFWLTIDNDTVQKSGAEVIEMLGEGMPEDTPVSSDDAPDEWKVAADFGLVAPAKEEVKKPVVPAKKTGPAPKPVAGTKATPVDESSLPPWKRGKK